jgi:DHA2 family metal-tetracycline-proton antiporter-like MFS transporter
MGLYLDQGIDADLRADQPALHQKVDGGARRTMFGASPSLNMDAVGALPPEEAEQLAAIVNANKKASFVRQAILPAFLLVCYLALFFYFKSRGGYRPVELDDDSAGGE